MRCSGDDHYFDDDDNERGEGRGGEEKDSDEYGLNNTFILSQLSRTLKRTRGNSSKKDRKMKNINPIYWR